MECIDIIVYQLFLFKTGSQVWILAEHKVWKQTNPHILPNKASHLADRVDFMMGEVAKLSCIVAVDIAKKMCDGFWLPVVGDVLSGFRRLVAFN